MIEGYVLEVWDILKSEWVGGYYRARRYDPVRGEYEKRCKDAVNASCPIRYRIVNTRTRIVYDSYENPAVTHNRRCP